MRQANRRHAGEVEQLRGRNTAVTGEDGQVIVDQDRIAKAKALNRVSDLANLPFGVGTSIVPQRVQGRYRRVLNREIGHDVLSWFYLPSRGHQPIKTAGAPRQLTERPAFAGGSVPAGQPRPLHYFGRTHAATISVSSQQY